MNRTINFTVNSSGTVSCNGSLRPQIAGVQGDRNVCTVNFDLTAIWDGTANYFLEFVSGTNVPYILTTDSDGVTLDTTNHIISVILSQEITADGGQVEVSLVQEKIDSQNETSTESNTYVTYLYFEPKSGVVQKLKNTAYGIFADIKKTVTSFITTMTTAFNELSSAVTSLSNTKVDKVSGKGLSTNDYTTAEKTKLYSIEEGAEANVQADWNESNSSADSFIKNKPITGVGVEIVTEYGEGAEPYNLLKAKVDGEKTQFDDYGNITVNTEVIASKDYVDGVSSNKVDKVSGKGLSTNDYTTAEKTKLYSIEEGAEANVQADWNESNSSADSFIKNKPITGVGVEIVTEYGEGAEPYNLLKAKVDGEKTQFDDYGDITVNTEVIASKDYVDGVSSNKVDKVSGKGLSTNDYTTAEKTKLYGIESGAEANVQSDWNESDSTKDGFIKNKPQNLVQDSNYVHTDNNFNNDYKSKIETNEYNDIFNIRVEWDRQYMPNAELIRIYYQYYESGRLTEDTASYNVKDIANGNVYLYRTTFGVWNIAVGTEPSSYGRLPMLVGNIATKTVNGENVKLFFRNGDDETQFDELNNNKVDKEGNWELIDTITTTDAEVWQVRRNIDSNGNSLQLKGIRIYVYLPTDNRTTANTINISTYPYNNYSGKFGGVYRQNTVGRSNISVFYQNKIENGFWYDSYEMVQGINPLTAKTYRTEPCTDSNAINRMNATMSPLCKSWGVETGGASGPLPLGTTIIVCGIK